MLGLAGPIPAKLHSSTSAVHRERAPPAHSRTASRGGPRASPRASPHARARVRPRARLTADTVGWYSAPPNSHIGDGGVATTDNAGHHRCQSDTPWLFLLRIAWKVTHLAATSIVDLPHSVSCEQLNKAWT